MKLTTKLLTTLTPVAVVGAITPSIVSCGCSGKEYTIEYGDVINCKDKKEKKTYKKVKKVQEAITNKIQVETNPEKVIDISNLNGKITSQASTLGADFQNIYYEFVYYYAYNEKDGFTLSDWSYETSNWKFALNGKECVGVEFKYTLKESKIYLTTTGGFEVSFASHTYEHCKGVE